MFGKDEMNSASKVLAVALFVCGVFLSQNCEAGWWPWGEKLTESEYKKKEAELLSSWQSSEEQQKNSIAEYKKKKAALLSYGWRLQNNKLNKAIKEYYSKKSPEKDPIEIFDNAFDDSLEFLASNPEIVINQDKNLRLDPKSKNMLVYVNIYKETLEKCIKKGNPRSTCISAIEGYRKHFTTLFDREHPLESWWRIIGKL